MNGTQRNKYESDNLFDYPGVYFHPSDTIKMQVYPCPLHQDAILSYFYK